MTPYDHTDWYDLGDIDFDLVAVAERWQALFNENYTPNLESIDDLINQHTLVSPRDARLLREWYNLEI